MVDLHVSDAIRQYDEVKKHTHERQSTSTTSASIYAPLSMAVVCFVGECDVRVDW
jgi:hypothetical protein